MGNREVEVSIVIPVKDEAENIETLARELAAALEPQSWKWECIWVDDGSSDGSLAILERLAESDSRHRFLSFDQNRGQSAAFQAGFKEARGAILATMDGDGQNDPSDIPKLVDIIRSGRMDMANGYRARRRDTLIRKLASRIANGFRNAVTGKTVRDVGCSTRAFRCECVANLPNFKGMHRFLPTLVAMQGFTLGELPVNHRPRTRGNSKYTINNRLWVGLVDTLGILWLRKRAFRYTVARKSGSRN
jgi:glycosyltransferase involved in cell wall biosynthesis